MKDDLYGAWDQLTSLGFAVFQAVAIFVIAGALVRAVRRPLRRRLASSMLPENAKVLVENTIALVVYVAGFTVLLALWGASWSTLLTAMGISSLLVALGLQSALQSLVAGIFILFERPYNVGDQIRYSGNSIGGTVEEIAFRSTIIRSETGTRIVTPNSLIFSQAVENLSPEQATRTIIIVSGAGSPGKSFEDLAADVATGLSKVASLTVEPVVQVRSPLERFRVPRLFMRIPRLGAWATGTLHRGVEQTTQVRIIWSGSSKHLTREDVLLMLKEMFPDSGVRLRRW